MLKQFTTLAVGQRISIHDTPYTVVGSVVYDGRRYEETHGGTDSGRIHYIEWIIQEAIGGTKRYLGESISERHDDGETGYDYELELTATRPLDTISIDQITPTHIEWTNAHGRKQKTAIRETEVVTVSYVSGDHDDSIIGETLQTFYIKDDPAYDIISIDREGTESTDTCIPYSTTSLGLNHPFVNISGSINAVANSTHSSSAYTNYAYNANSNSTYTNDTNEYDGCATRISRIIMTLIRIWILVIVLGRSLISRGPWCAKYRQPPYTQGSYTTQRSGGSYLSGSARSYYYRPSYSSIPRYCQTDNGSSHGSSSSGRSGYSGK